MLKSFFFTKEVRPYNFLCAPQGILAVSNAMQGPADIMAGTCECTKISCGCTQVYTDLKAHIEVELNKGTLCPNSSYQVLLFPESHCGHSTCVYFKLSPAISCFEKCGN